MYESQELINLYFSTLNVGEILFFREGSISGKGGVSIKKQGAKTLFFK